MEFEDSTSFLTKKKPLVEGRTRSGKVISKLYTIYIYEISAAVYVSSSSRSINGSSSSTSSSNSNRPSRIINRKPIAQPIAMQVLVIAQIKKNI